MCFRNFFLYDNLHCSIAHMLTISLIAQKGGVGKTSVARCLAVAFERSGIPTAILDMDPQGSATAWGHRREEEHPEVIPTLVPHLANTLEVASSAVKVVIVDTPPKNADVAIAAVRVSDLVIIPCRPQIDDIETLPAAKQVLDMTGGSNAVVVLNCVPPAPARSREAIAAITGHPKAPFTVCPHFLGYRVAFGDSSVLGLTPQEYAPRSKAARETENVHRYIMELVS